MTDDIDRARLRELLAEATLDSNNFSRQEELRNVAADALPRLLDALDRAEAERDSLRRAYDMVETSRNELAEEPK